MQTLNIKPIWLIAVMTVLFALASDPHAAQIYKTVDKDGNVVFTDVPPKDQGKAIKLDSSNTYTPAVPTASPAQVAEDSAAEETQTVDYQQLRIISPMGDEPVRENAGNVSVEVSINPSLDTYLDHSLQILVDGNVMASGNSPILTLTNVDRGSHALMAQVVDSAGVVQISSAPVTFHMLRFSQQGGPAARPKPKAR